ncbi:hypothetical protein [Ilumatobacter nonamiensis]|uniref:hypothetical protein n=1 Tax=Ilumatobacter nonamiensis TaxID=467093 RepID=UPI00034CD3E9|nr:hypothetical protein [Ilumatobacter nonamiensis]
MAIAGAAIAVVVVMFLLGMGPSILLVTALVAVIGVGIWFVLDLSIVAVGSDGFPTAVAPPPTVSADRRVARLRSGLAYGRSSDDSFELLRASLVELIDDQLLAVHEIDRLSDPAAASQVLGPELTRFVEDERTVKQLARPRSLDRIVTLIEQL